MRGKIEARKRIQIRIVVSQTNIAQISRVIENESYAERVSVQDTSDCAQAQPEKDLAFDERLAAAVDKVACGEHEILLEVEEADVIDAADLTTVNLSCSSADSGFSSEQMDGVGLLLLLILITE